MATCHRLARYEELLTETQTESLVDTPRHSELEDSVVLNTLWTAQEKANLFTALERCGKGNLPEVVRRVGSKSLVEVTAYIGILDEETERRRGQGRGVFEFERVPAAVEVDDTWLDVEEKYSSEIAKMEDTREINAEEEDADDQEEMILSVEDGNELASWKYNPKLSADTIRSLETLARKITKQLLDTIFFLVSSQTLSADSSIAITLSVVRTAIDLLSLPRHIKNHFASLPSRMQKMGVRVNGVEEESHETFEKEFGKRGRDVDVAEYELSRNKDEKRRVQTLKPWPEKWSHEEGFAWDMETVDVSSKRDEDFEVASQGTLGSEMTDDESQNQDECLQPSSSSECDTSEEDELYDEVSDEDLQLLDAETSYLDALDLQYSQIEQQRLYLHVDQGQKVSRQFTEMALDSFTSNDDTVQKKLVWDKARKRLRSKFGKEWAEYTKNFVDWEGEGWEGPPERWELFRKKNPMSDVDVEVTGMKRSGTIGKTTYGRKRKIEEVEEAEEVNDEIEDDEVIPKDL